MRFEVVIVSIALFTGCQSPRISRDDTAHVASSLERRITKEEAYHLLLDDIDRSLQAPQSGPSSKTEADMLIRQRRQVGSRLESFLSRFREGDQLWLYRTYVTGDRRGGQSGFALLRDGAVVEHISTFIYD